MLIKMHFETEDQIISQLKELIEKDKEIVNKSVNLSKDTLLHYAAYHKKAKIINFLLSVGANKNAENSFKLVPKDVIYVDDDNSDRDVVDNLVKILSQ